METVISINDSIIATEIKPKNVRNTPGYKPSCESHRYNSDTGIYNCKPNDPDYFQKYYHEKLQGVRVECQCCHKMVLKTKLFRHIKTKKCMMCKPSEESPLQV